MDFDLQPTLKGRLIEARPLRPDDLDAAFDAGSDPLIWKDHPDPNRYRRDVFQKFFHGAIVPPSNALNETLEDVCRAMAAGGALLAYVDNVAVGTARYQMRNDHLYLERVGVVPECRRRGVSAALIAAIEAVARNGGQPEIRLAVRASLPSNLRHYENLGYRAFDSAPHPRGPDWVIWLRKQV